MNEKQFIESEAAKLIVGDKTDGFKVTIKHGILKIRTSIPYVSAENVARISGQVAKISEIDPNNLAFDEIMKNCKDVKHVCRSIAIAMKFPFNRLMTWLVYKLPYSDIQKLWNIVQERIDGERFFFITASAKKQNKLMKLQER